MVEKFNSTLTTIIAKHAAVYGAQWDKFLCQLLFEYRVNCHESTKESPFFSLYGRDAPILTESTLTQQRKMSQIHLDDYKLDMLDGFTTAWKTAQLKTHTQPEQV